MTKSQIKILSSLIDKNAISFLIANEKEHEGQYDNFLKVNNMQYKIGIDLSTSPDETAYSPL